MPGFSAERKGVSAKHHGSDPEVWLADALERLPAMTNLDDLGALRPSRWQPATPADTRTPEACGALMQLSPK